MSLVKVYGTRNLRKVKTPRDADLAGGVFNFNVYNGSDGTGPGNKIFQTSRSFVVDDKSLMVFKNGVYQYEGTNYQVLDSKTILFIQSVALSDKIALIVNGGTILRDASATNSYNIAQLAGDLYGAGSTALKNTGVKNFSPNYNLQALTSTFHAVVGPNGTHASIDAAINDVQPGSKILIDRGTYYFDELYIGKSVTLEGVGYGTTFQSADNLTGLYLAAPGICLDRIRFSGYSTAIEVGASSCMITRNWFQSNSVDIDYSSTTQVVIEGNIKE